MSSRFSRISAVWLVAVSALAIACGGDGADGQGRDAGGAFDWLDAGDGGAADSGASPDAGDDSSDTTDDAQPDAPAPDADVAIDTADEPPPRAEGVIPGSAPAALADWERLCASCHGTLGEGGIGPSLAGTELDRDALIVAIETRMPPNDPTLCEGACAERMADAVLGWIDATDADACGALVAPGPRALRLLTRRELANTLRDLLGSDAACPPVTFWHDAPGARTVHVAGSFNGWAGTIAGGGWAMTRSGDSWALTRDVPPGRHTYKFVVDESVWVADARAAESESDGFGGTNSVLRVDCETSVDPGALARVVARFGQLPLEGRPLGFHFETHAQSGALSSSTLESLLDIGRESAALVTPALALELAGCDVGAGDAACRRRFVEALATRAWRRPASTAQVDRLDALAASEDDIDDGLALAAEAIFASPRFLYRAELGTDAGDGTARLDVWEYASALSYALTGSAPDAELLEAAATGALDEPGEAEAQALRLLATPGARDTLEAFAEQWLGTEKMASVTRSPAFFPGFDDALRDAMRAEARRFVSYVVFDGAGTFEELLKADTALLNARLAAIYGVAGVEGDDLRVVELDDPRRSGILTLPAVMATTAHSDQTSPIRRGLFVRQRLLCQDFPPPPPEAGGVPEVDPDASTRERFAQHTADLVCAGCHQYIDDLGFGFEHYDPIGAWRDAEPSGAIDARGRLNDAEGFGSGSDAHFDTIRELASLLADSDAARRCFVREYRRFVVGDAESPDDACGLAALDATFDAAGTRIQDLMIAVVTDPGFRRRR